MSTFTDNITEPTVLYPNSGYESKYIDASLLCMDYLYIYNYLRNDSYINASYGHENYQRAFNESYVVSMRHGEWLIYANIVSGGLNESFMPAHTKEDNVRFFISLNEKAKGLSTYNANEMYKIYTLTRGQQVIPEPQIMSCLPQDVFDSQLEERLMILDDYMENDTMPDKCINTECNSCPFDGQCAHSNHITG